MIDIWTKKDIFTQIFCIESSRNCVLNVPLVYFFVGSTNSYSLLTLVPCGNNGQYVVYTNSSSNSMMYPRSLVS